MEDDKVAARVLNPTEYDEVVTTKDAEIIVVFLSQVIHTRMNIACTSVGLNVITQALHVEEGSLAQDLTIQNAYTKMHNDSKNVTIVVKNSMVSPQTLKKKIPVARVVVDNWVLELQIQPGMIEMLDEAQAIQMPKLTVKQKQEKTV